MRRVASSRPRRWGMDTIRGLDNSRPPRLRAFIWGTPCVRASHTKRGIATAIPLGLECDARPLAGVAAIAIRVAIAHAAPAGGFGRLPAGRVAGGAGMAGPAALFLHLMTRGVTGCAGMAGQRAPVLHSLAIVRRRRA